MNVRQQCALIVEASNWTLVYTRQSSSMSKVILSLSLLSSDEATESWVPWHKRLEKLFSEDRLRELGFINLGKGHGGILSIYINI